MLSVSAATSMVAEYKTDVERTLRLPKEETDDVEIQRKAFKDGFIRTSDDMYGRTPYQGKPVQSLNKI